jgi:hypothetical protein
VDRPTSDRSDLNIHPQIQFYGTLSQGTSAKMSAVELKEKGNQLFKQGDFSGAEDLFSQACASPTFHHPPKHN